MLVNTSPQRVSGSDRLGRYYTDDAVSTFLVRQMNVLRPGNVVDLGAGQGGLSAAAAKRWTESRILTVDVDVRSRAALNEIFASDGRHMHLRASALRAHLPERIRSFAATVEAAVCNPPFIMPRWRREYLDILVEAGFASLPAVTRDIEAPAIFLAQNMRILSDGAPLGIILPDSLISSHRYRWFRQSLLENYHVSQVVKLPRMSFRGTDALAHVVTVEKRASSSSQIELCRISGGRVSDACSISISEGIDRLDVDFHTSRRHVERNSAGRDTLLARGCDVRRGSIEHAVARRSGIRVLHTTDVDVEDLGQWIDLPRKAHHCRAPHGFVTAEAGDILLARVGRNFDAKIVGVRSGSALLTDCVYRIRAPKKNQRALLRSLSSGEGRAWLRSQAYGVGATHLAKASLLQFSH